MVDTHLRSVRPDDRHNDLLEWIAALKKLTIDIREDLAGTLESIANANAIDKHAHDFRQSYSQSADALVRKLAVDAGTYDEAIPLAVGAVTLSGEEQRNAVLALLSRASGRSRDSAWNQFNSSAPALVEKLRARHDDVIETVRSNRIDANLTTIELATRARCGDKWIALEQAHGKWELIHGLHRAWLINRCLPSKGSRPLANYLPIELQFRDAESVMALPHLRAARGIWLSQAVDVGDPEMLSIAEVDRLRSQAPTVTAADNHLTAAQRRARDNEAAALAVDAKPKPARTAGMG